MTWQPIETAPKDERILVHNEMWDMTFGTVQIATQDSGDGEWAFDSGMNIDADPMWLDDGIEPEDYAPQGWQPLPTPPDAVERDLTQ